MCCFRRLSLLLILEAGTHLKLEELCAAYRRLKPLPIRKTGRCG
jgi:hypothetical protein